MTNYENRWHFPTETAGCYYERPESCCLLCYGRFCAHAFRTALSQALE